MIESDITRDANALIDDLSVLTPVHLVLHFASPASSVDYSQLPLATLDVNSKGNEFCARAALRWNARLKRFGEALVMAYVRAKNLDARIIRIFNTYGPRMRRNDGRVVPNFITQALRDEPLTIYGDGSQPRSFCYIDDLVVGIMVCAESEKTRGRS